MKPASPNLVVGLSCFSATAPNLPSLVEQYYSPLSSERNAIYKDELFGSSPNLPGSSPDLTGSSPNLTGSAPNLAGSSPNLTGSLPDLAGSSPNLTGSSPNLSGSDPTLPPVEHARGAPWAPANPDPFLLLLKSIESAFADAGLQEVPKNTAIFLVMDEAEGFPYSLATEINEHYLSQGLDLTVMLSSHTEPSLQEALNWLDRGECELALVATIDRLKSKSTFGSPAAAAILMCRANIANSMKLRAYACLEQENWLNTKPSSISMLEASNPGWFQNTEACKSWESLRKEKPENLLIAGLAASINPANTETATPHDEICYISSLGAELSAGSELLQPMMSIIGSALAHHLRIIPASGNTELSLQLNEQRVSLQTKSARPWIYPGSPVEPLNPRNSFVDLNSFGLRMSDHGKDADKPLLKLIKKQSSELFVFQAESAAELKIELQQLLSRLRNETPLHTLSYECNCKYAKTNPANYRLAIVAVKHNELQRLLNEAIAHLDAQADKAISPPAARAIGIYYSGNAPALEPGKLAFVLPGLGASYPQMLFDLCFYFPEVRQVFDFVERLALRAGDKVIPSRAVFPVAGSKIYVSSQAMLATMDSSVITLLLAEWAIYALLKKLDIHPDVLLGCSTGEFAALTMSEAIDIIKAAETFYHLSTGVSRSIPINKLAGLRTFRVSASFEQDIAPLLAQIKDPVYLGADLSQNCALISGERNAMDELSKLLKEKDIDFLTLPVAIPYHTPLVAGKVSDKDEDVQKLSMRAPLTEAWSCSTGEKYPAESEQLRKISTGLFEKPIRLRSTIKRLHESGVRIFIEAGPKGGLVPYISEILHGEEHVAVATNVQNKSGIDQLNAMLAILYCHGVNMNLYALYESPTEHDVPEANQLNLKLEFEEQKTVTFDADSQNTESLQLSDSIYEFMQWSQPYGDPQDLGFLSSELGMPTPANDEVLFNYLSTMQQMHSSMLDSQEMMMMAYLQSLETDYPELNEITDTGLAFLQKPVVRELGDHFQLDFALSTGDNLFLLDHAIGGATSQLSDESRVYLLPLMVALEIMAEGASLMYPYLQIARLLDIRAYRRIRVSARPLNLYLELRTNEENFVDVSICMQETETSDRIVLASCKVEMSYQLSHDPARLELPSNEPRQSKFASKESLYGPGAMFHGPRMQSVQSIDRLAKRSITGKVACRSSENWFSHGQPRRMLIDPLLLDNASQFVLYQMFEHDFALSALLPFHIQSIEFFQGYHEQENQTLTANAVLRSMSLRGTEANIELLDPNGIVIAKVNDISSRAIVLPELMRKFIEDPRTILCEQVNIAELKDAAITAINKLEIPEDETTLDWLTDYLLSESEQQEWRKVGKTEKRRYDWLSGRIAAKDAVRLLLKKELGIEVKPADICIENTESGAARVYLKELEAAWLPQISISHCGGMAAAIAERPNPSHNAGIDIEEIIEREEGFAKLAFTEKEFAWINSGDAASRAQRIATLWTAKEAAAKAHGSGFGSHLKHFEFEKEENNELFYISVRLENMEHSKLYKCSVKELGSTKTMLSVVCAASADSPGSETR